ncbi:MAG TPA: hypothetical protein PKC19_21345 [Roseiflexaceae bacterium]|nr:hypothetical protein [Roseiflexaceae bacterium]
MARLSRLMGLLLAFLLLIGAAFTPSGVAARTTTEHFREVIPVDWEVSPDRCGRLVATTTGTGQLTVNVSIQHLANGDISVGVSEIAKGWESDTFGNSYRWNSRIHTAAKIPAGEGRVYVQMSDHFALTGGGQGATAPFNIGLLWTWSYPHQGDLPPYDGLWPPGPDLHKINTIGTFNTTATGIDCDLF